MTFGYELEFCGASLYELSELLRVNVKAKTSKINYQNFNIMKEERITNEKLVGGELISPIYTDLELCLKELKEKLILLKENGAYIPDNSFMTGFHVHIGKDVLDSKVQYETRQNYEKLLKFLYAFESEIYVLASYGGNIRRNFWDNARPLDFNDIINFLCNFPYSNVFGSKKNAFRIDRETYELRYFNSSLDEKDLESSLKFATQLSKYVISDDFDYDKVDYYFRNRDYIGRNPKLERRLFMNETLKLNV